MKSIVPIVLTASSLVAQAENPSLINQLENNYQAGRIRTEYNRVNEIDSMRTTLGASSNPNNYKNNPGSVAALFESFRLNNDHNLDINQNYTSLGTVVPLKFDNISSSTLVFGTFGDKQGLGLEQTLSFQNISPSISLEKNFDNEQTRIGGELEYKIGKVKAALGFDSISEPKRDEITQVLTRVRYDIDKTDSLGIALAHKDYGNKTENSALGVWAHSSKDSLFSARLIYQFTRDSQGKDTHFGQLIFAPSPAAYLVMGGAEYFMDRRASRGEEPFSMNVTPLSVSSIQAVPAVDRVKAGPVFIISDRHISSSTVNSDTFTLGAGYVKPFGKDSFLSTFAEYSFSDAGSTRQESISPRVRLDLGRFELGARYSIPLNSKTKPGLLLEAQVDF